MPYFSVTIPVYNVEKYIHQCLDSVLNQTFEDFEVIILNDGSTDSCGDICDEYVKKDKRISVVHDKNMGLLMARRRALQYVTGEYVLFLDGDDYWKKDLLQSIYNITNENKVDMVLFRYQAVNGQGKELYKQKKLLKNKELLNDAGKYLCYQLATNFEYNSMALKVIKREKIDILADYSDVKTVSMGEDALQSARISKNIDTIVYLSKPLYNYRVNISSISTKITEKHVEDYMKVRAVIGEGMKEWYKNDSPEYIKKLEYDVRGFVGVLADVAISSLVSKEQWRNIQKEIISSELMKYALLYKSRFSSRSKVYLYAILKLRWYIWRMLGRVKFILKYLYDRLNR